MILTKQCRSNWSQLQAFVSSPVGTLIVWLPLPEFIKNKFGLLYSAVETLPTVIFRTNKFAVLSLKLKWCKCKSWVIDDFGPNVPFTVPFISCFLELEAQIKRICVSLSRLWYPREKSVLAPCSTLFFSLIWCPRTIVWLVRDADGCG